MRKKTLYLSLLLAFMYFTSYFTRKDFAVCIAAIVEQGILTKPQAGTVCTALFITYGAGQLLSGWLSDKFPPNRVAATGLLITSICNIFIPFSTTLFQMTALWAINGLAQSFMWPPIVRMLSMYLNREEYDKGYLIVCYGCYLGNIVLYLIVPLCLQVGSWKTIFFLATAVGLLCLSLLLMIYPALVKNMPLEMSKKQEKKEENQAEAPKNEGLWKALCSSGTIALVAAVALQGFLKDGIETWLPTFFSETFSFSAGSSILSGIVLPVFSIVMATVATNLHRKVLPDEAKGNAMFFGICSVLLLVLFITYGTTPAFISLLCMSISSGCLHGGSIYASMIPLRFRKYGKVGTLTGFINACSYVGSAVSCFGVSLIAEKMGWRNTILSWVIVAVVGLLLCVAVVPKFAKIVKKNA